MFVSSLMARADAFVSIPQNKQGGIPFKACRERHWPIHDRIVGEAETRECRICRPKSSPMRPTGVARCRNAGSRLARI
jgi:hypothetical protein